jgi:hypothetical protein
MPIAVFGKKVFSVSNKKIHTFSELAWSGELLTEAQEKVGSKPSTYIKGLNLDSLSFSIQLKSIFGMDVRREIESWEEIKLDAEPAIFVLGTKPLGQNKWLLKSTSVSDTIIDNRGRITAAVIKLDFEEYVRNGTSGNSKKTAKKSSKKAPAVAVNIAPSNYINSVNKGDKKRSNLNASNAVAKGKKT